MQRCTGTVQILLETRNTELGRLLDETPSSNTSSGVPQEYTHIVETHKGRRTGDSKGEKHDYKGVLDLGFQIMEKPSVSRRTDMPSQKYQRMSKKSS